MFNIEQAALQASTFEFELIARLIGVDMLPT